MSAAIDGPRSKTIDRKRMRLASLPPADQEQLRRTAPLQDQRLNRAYNDDRSSAKITGNERGVTVRGSTKDDDITVTRKDGQIHARVEPKGGEATEKTFKDAGQRIIVYPQGGKDRTTLKGDNIVALDGDRDVDHIKSTGSNNRLMAEKVDFKGDNNKVTASRINAEGDNNRLSVLTRNGGVRINGNNNNLDASGDGVKLETKGRGNTHNGALLNTIELFPQWIQNLLR